MKESFSIYSSQLDQIHDRYERLVKASRDITISSKKLIFSLLRPGNVDPKIDSSLHALFKLWKPVIKELSEGNSGDFWKYRRAFSPGTQEFVESITLYFFLKEFRLVSLSELEGFVRTELQQTQTENNASLFSISIEDYLLGVLDLTGEIMRFGLNSISQGDVESCKKAHSFVQSISNFFMMISTNHIVDKNDTKIQTLRQSLLKLEQAIFKTSIRLSEFPQGTVLPPPALLSDDPMTS